MKNLLFHFFIQKIAKEFILHKSISISRLLH